MPILTYWMIAYGAVLIACGVIDSLSPLRFGLASVLPVPAWADGCVMVAAGLAAAQGRRSLRLGGLYVGILLPLLLAAKLSWDGIRLWRDAAATGTAVGPVTAISALALFSWIVFALLLRLRPREGIASRGYAIPLPTPVKPVLAGSDAAVEPERRSEAG